MVSKQTHKCKAVKTKKSKFRKIFGLFLIAILAAGMAFGIGLGIKIILNEENNTVVEENTVIETQPVEEPVIVEDKLPQPVDFQPVVNQWVNSVGGNKSVIIYDLDRSEVVAKYNEAESYNTASLYKLFVVYEGYRRLQSGEWKADDIAGSTGHTILECLDLAIRESYSPCAETLWGYIGRDNLDNIIQEEYGIVDSDISNLISNANDIMAIMRKFYEHKSVNDSGLLSRMKDSFLKQPPTTYNWRQGLPSGFTKANVYNKVGWDYNPSGYWNIYHDAAIVEFPDSDRHFIVVVMTNHIPFEQIRQLGANIEATYENNQ